MKITSNAMSPYSFTVLGTSVGEPLRGRLFGVISQVPERFTGCLSRPSIVAFVFLVAVSYFAGSYLASEGR